MERKIYIDYTHGVNATDKTKFHGGGDFSRMITHEIINTIEKSHRDYRLIVVWPKGYIPKTEDENSIFNSPKVTIQQVEKLTSVSFETNSTLFIPLIENTGLGVLKDIKMSNKDIKVYCVIHGTRLLDLRYYDKYDRFYYTGYRRLPYINWIRRNIAGIIIKRNFKRYLKYADKIFTVSNNSLQGIIKYYKPKYIKYFLRKSKYINEEKIDYIYKDKYVLFVNANRYEKNFLRSLVAFCKYKKASSDDLYLYAIGINKEFSNMILNNPLFDREIIERWVRFFDYVSEKELDDLYKQCSFLLYTSKSEGFGLPPLEAMEVGKPTVASYVSSIPEVLGCAAYYVDPYDEESIANGISHMADEENQKYYINLLRDLKPVLRLRGEIDTRCLIEEILK